MQQNEIEEYSLKDLWNFLVEKEDITITVDIHKVDYIRKGLAKIKHREKEQIGEFADESVKFNTYPIPQTREEKEDSRVRLRLVLRTQEGFNVHKIQVNDVDDLPNTG